ncbi:MAG: NAD-dependent epimerase/dehydratase family protein [Alphaproteobacteria bacterium]|nr:NAD-dependent epimerase/dehydratase family protein [Alphaproteobacteria bacterium]
MTIAITGGAGFIGTVLAQQLIIAGRSDLRLIDIRRSEAFPELTFDADVRDEDAMLRALQGVTTLYHLAAEHRDDVRPISKYYDVNVQGGRNVLKAARAHNIRQMIFTSSVALYGLDAGHSKEEDIPKPFNDYGASKLESESDFKTWAAEDPQRRLAIVRLVATFGPGNRGNIYTLMEQIARGRFVMVGRGDNCKSIAYVENVAAFLRHIAQGPAGSHLYNYADKPDLSMNDFVRTVRVALGYQGQGLRLPYAMGLCGGYAFDTLAKITGRRFPISAVRVQKFCANTIVDARRAGDSGFTAPHTLEEGLRAMIAAEFPDHKKAA